MKREELQKIKDKISILMGMRMVEINRWDSYAEFGFTSAGRDEESIQEHLRTVERIDYEYVIAAFCMFRWTYKDRVVLADQDIFQPSIPLLKENGLNIRESEEIENFDFNERGNNRFDEINEQNFKPVYHQTRGFIVKKMNVSKFGDLTMEFENGYRLEIFINVSDPHNCWEFYEIGKQNNITIGSNVIVDEDVDVTKL